MTKGQRKGFVGALTGLFVFGTAYAYLVHRLGDAHKGYTWVLVCVGDAVVVLAMAPFIGWKNALRLFVAFVAAGAPMCYGDIVKGVTALRRAEYTTQRIIGGVASRGLQAAGSLANDNAHKAPTRERL